MVTPVAKGLPPATIAKNKRTRVGHPDARFADRGSATAHSLLYTRSIMDYKAALSKLEDLLVAMKKVMIPSPQKDDYENFCTLYGEVEELVRRFGGENRVEVPLFSGAEPAVYPNFIEAGFLSGRTIHRHEGYTQLLKIIGKVRQASADPHSLPAPPTVTNLIQTLRRFRECCQYIQAPPQNEREVQDTIWIMLRSQYERVDREDMLPRFGAKAYRPYLMAHPNAVSKYSSELQIRRVHRGFCPFKFGSSFCA